MICVTYVVERLIVVNWCLILHPCVFLEVLSIISCVESAMPGGDILNGKPARFMVPWISLSVGLNIIVTLMICFRLLRMRALMREVLSPEMSSMYTDIAAMLVESAAPFSILGIGVVITAAQKGPLMFAFGDVWFMFCVEFNFSLLTLVSAPKANLTKPFLCFLSVSLPSNDHPPGRHGPWIS